MNFRDPKLVLVKNFRGNTKSFFQVSHLTNQEVVLKDVESGGKFTFPKKQLESFLQHGKLKATSIDELPPCLFEQPVTRRQTITKKKSDDLAHHEMERRYQYVTGVIEAGLPAYTEKWLAPYIEMRSTEIDDGKPPSWRALSRWMKLYIESGWEKKSLLSGHSEKGNRTVRLPQELDDLVNNVVRDYTRTHAVIRFTKAYNEFLERLSELNKERLANGLDELKPCSYRTFRNRFRH
ncbi:hypothetical protein MD588_02300 [Photobacterium sp. SDRW27]|uniref:hypothetical protein n=1 Tax=Photobacterium obscurum TaxID=2829490 RepID=UPI00224466C3|nr:hypothetical protein [Photobacterium obscurum]MCW8327635.1 hypothetical protein [Photobacterium obscurum]